MINKRKTHNEADGHSRRQIPLIMVLFSLAGVGAFLWFLIRVIPT
jgi:hypothetical protein